MSVTTLFLNMSDSESVIVIIDLARKIKKKEHAKEKCGLEKRLGHGYGELLHQLTVVPEGYRIFFQINENDVRI